MKTIKWNIFFLLSSLVFSTTVLAISQQCISAATGLWSESGTWVCNFGTIPEQDSDVTIIAGHLVTLDVDSASLTSIVVETGGDLDVASSGSGLTLNGNAFANDFDIQNASINLSGDLTINAQGHNILLGEVDGGFGLTLNSSAETKFLGIVGGTIALTSLITDLEGTTVFADTHGDTNDPNIVVKGVREFNDPVLLATTTNISGNNGSLVFKSTINSETTTSQRFIISGVQNATIVFNDNVGLINQLNKIQMFNVFNSTVSLNLEQFITLENQQWPVNLKLNSLTDNVSLTSSSGGTIDLGSTSTYIRGINPNEEALSINTTGIVNLNATIGDDNKPLTEFTVNMSSVTNLNSNSITCEEGQNYLGPVVLEANSLLSADTVVMQSTVDIGGFDLTLNTTVTSGNTKINGVLSGTGDLIKNGTGSLDFYSINSLTGNILLNQGKLNNQVSSDAIFPNVPVLSLVTGTQLNLGDPILGNYVINDNQSVTGNGIVVGNLITRNGATVSPGFSPGRLFVDEINMDIGSILSIEINGNTVTTDYDQLVLDQGGSLGDATLDLTIGFNPIIGDTFNIISSGSALSGNFSGIPEGGLFVVDDKLFSISYVAGNGNDVVLTFVGSSIIHVDASATPGGDGQSWNTAFDNLQDALAVAVTGVEVWLADGVYYPNVSTGSSPQDQTLTFTLIEGVNLYGGFAGNETELGQRNPETNITILSGDIDGDDFNIDTNNIAETVIDIQGSNSYHVLNGQNITDSTLIDGFTITAGNASFSPADVYGGGMVCNESDGPSINNIIFVGNKANDQGGATYGCANAVSNSQYLSNQGFSGGAIFSDGGNFNNVEFISNESIFGRGGALFTKDSTILENVLFRGNATTFDGGAIYMASSGGSHSFQLINVTITGNKASSGSGGGIYANSTGSLDIINSIIWNNQDNSGQGTASSAIVSNLTINNSYSLIQGFGSTGTGNLDQDPLFITDTDPTTAPNSLGNAHLMPISITIDAGDDTAVTSLYDLDGEDRIQGVFVDMGAYEYTDLIFANGFE
jgi:hypothetical protein